MFYVFGVRVLVDGEVCAARAAVLVCCADPGEGADGYLREEVFFPLVLARQL